jgi:hypothetical protein
MERRQQQRGGVISEVEDATYSVLRKHERRAWSEVMRKFLFGWICRLRGMHRSGKEPKFLSGAVKPASREIVHVRLEFSCICGATNERYADVERGGRVPVPFEWPVEGKCL